MFRRHYIRELSSYLDNELPEKKRRIIETHLAGCARCRDELRQLQLLSVKLKEWRAPVMEEGFESTVRNTIVAQELERGTSQMKKTWTIMVPSGVLAAVLVVLFVGKQYLPKGPQVPIDKNQSVAVTTPHVAPKVPPPVVSQVPTVHDPALKIKLSEPSMQGPVFAYQGVMDAQRYYSGGYSPPPQTLMQRMMQEDSLAGYYPSQSEFFQEDYNRIYENEFRLVRNDSLSTFSIDVDTASYANVRRFLNGNTLPPEDAVRIEELVNYFTYDYPQPQGTDPFSVTTEVAVCPWNSGHRIALIGLQGKTMQTQDLPASNLVFLIDVSGSMKDYNKLPLLKSAFRLLVQQLRPEDRVSIVVYAGASGVVIDSVSGDQEEIIMQAIENLQAGGSTAGAAGIVQAYEIAKKNLRQDGNNRVILATDGDFNVGL
ncbi:MAG: von Willebrand factor type A domain-containing protein, partial [Candidatus Omnitrophica bacterium]|nr:von Willebrand factor type A domain-containing protein [Candidatus Omnitrophota bacterium]